MQRARFLLVAGLTGTVALAACNTSTGEGPDKTMTGAAIGAGLGAIAGEIFGDENKDVYQGAVIGAILGGSVGFTLDQQEEELRRALANRDVEVANTGSELVVTFPESVTFDTGSAELRRNARRDIYAVADHLVRYPGSDVEVIGHTDDVGPADYNMGLSSRRAFAVADLLIAEGVSPRRIIASGRGETTPVASNYSESGRAQNRRVEIIIRPTERAA